MPCQPSKIICVGLNYVEHARELNMKLPEEPIIFLKPPTAALGPGGEIVYPSSSRQVDYEGELAVVIGKRAGISRRMRREAISWDIPALMMLLLAIYSKGILNGPEPRALIPLLPSAPGLRRSIPPASISRPG